MLIVGLVALALGGGAALSPDTVAAEYGEGWLYMRFGLAGIVGTLGAMGVVFVVWGVLGIRHALMQRRRCHDLTA